MIRWLASVVKLLDRSIYTLQEFKEKREMGAESLFKELMADNFPNLGERNRHLDPGSIHKEYQI